MAFPLTSVVDTFDRANANNLGANWIIVWGTGPGIISNQVYRDEADDWALPYWSSAFGAAAEAYMTIPTMTEDGNVGLYISLLCNISGGVEDGYQVGFDKTAGAANDPWTIIRLDDDVGTQLGGEFYAGGQCRERCRHSLFCWSSRSLLL